MKINQIIDQVDSKLDVKLDVKERNALHTRIYNYLNRENVVEPLRLLKKKLNQLLSILVKKLVKRGKLKLL